MDNGKRMELNQWAREQQVRTLRFGPKVEKPFDPKRKLPLQAVASAPILPQPEMHRYVERFASVFRRRDTMRNAEIYLLGLCSDLPHKNGETMEAAIPGADQQDIYNFLVRSGWRPEELDKARIQHWIQERGHVGRGVHVILDETSFVKQGQLSVGVARQYLGCVGKVANGQVTVSLHGAWDDDDVPLTGELYLPKQWAKDAQRCRMAKVPEPVAFRTKLEIGRQLLERVEGWGLEIAMVHGDAGYGEGKLMTALEDQGWAYCLGVRGNFTVYVPEEGVRPAPPPETYAGRGRPRKAPQPERPLHTVDDIRQAIDPAAWHRIAYRQGTNGVLEREFAALRVHPATQERYGKEAWLLLERPLNADSDDPKQYILMAPLPTPLAELARLAHIRPRIERASYENAKDAAGLADYQGRSWPGFHRHLAMVWLAVTWLNRQRRPLAYDDLPPAPSTPSGADGVADPQHPDNVPRTELRFAGSNVHPRAAIPGAADHAALPRQRWESLQAVRRRFLDWCRVAVFHELLLLGRSPDLPQLTLALGVP